ncbi:MAG: hypothetical protein ACYC4R_07715 [Anaerolineae bacterium]
MELGVSYVPSHLPQHLDTDMRHLRGIGCTEVLVTLQENHLVHLTGAVQFGAQIAQEYGIRPYAVIWGFANTFGGGPMSLVMLNDTDLWRVAADGSRMPRACLNNPKLLDRFMEYAAQCRACGYQGVFVDEPTPQVCFCHNCREQFAQAYGRDLATAVGTPAYEAFTRDTVRNYTDTLCKRVKALDPDYKTIACVMPVDRECFEAVAAISELDIFGTDPYWLVSNGRMTIEDAVADAELVKAICRQNGKASQIWLNCWRIPAGQEDEIYRGGKRLAAVGCDALYTWDYMGGLGTDEACDRPEVAWAALSKLYRELAGIS